jgi:regulator of replication initiation timing
VANYDGVKFRRVKLKKKLQVFVSSTYEDLKMDRQAAVSAILKAGHIPAGMELFTSGDKSQMDTIRRWIDESDVYMLIFGGGRYGSVEPNTEVSYTELEYDYALEQEKPLFAVVINEGALELRVRESGTYLMEKENPKLLSMFREKVLSNISSFFSDDKDIKLCVYESLSDFSGNRDLKGWVSSDEVVNSQSLLDEITRLNQENENLKQSLESAEKKVTKPSKAKNSEEDFDDLIKILKATEVKIPEILSDEEGGHTENLLDLFSGKKETFITGVTNKHNSTSSMSFLYFNISPKLQIHGLVVNEKVASVMWRRFAITQKGIALLARLERDNLLQL